MFKKLNDITTWCEYSSGIFICKNSRLEIEDELLSITGYSSCLLHRTLQTII